MQVVRDPEAYQLLADETRRKIIYLLRVKEMTVGQLASQLNLTPQAVYHHVKKLLKGEMVEVTREERSGHMIESYYRATAETFSLSYGKMKTGSLRDREMSKERVVASLNVLKTLGFKLDYDENKIYQLVDVMAELEECCSDEKLEDSIYERDDLDYLVKATAKELASTISMSDEEAARHEKIRKKLRTLLLSMVKK